MSIGALLLITLVASMLPGTDRSPPEHVDCWVYTYDRGDYTEVVSTCKNPDGTRTTETARVYHD